MRLDDKLEDPRNSLAEKTKRAVDLASRERCFGGASSWLAVIPVKEMDLIATRERLKMQSI